MPGKNTAAFRCYSEINVLHARVQGCSSTAAGGTAGNRRGFVEASPGKDVESKLAVLAKGKPRRLARGMLRMVLVLVREQSSMVLFLTS